MKKIISWIHGNLITLFAGLIMAAFFVAALMVTVASFFSSGPPKNYVRSGESIIIADEKGTREGLLCTLGPITNDGTQGFTAGHCLENGTDVYDRSGAKIGTATKEEDRDLATITFTDNVTAEPDNVTATYELQLGQTLCFYSRNTETEHCGEIQGKDHGDILVSPDMHSVHGNSGAEVYDLDKNPIGVIVGALYPEDHGAEDNQDLIGTLVAPLHNLDEEELKR